MVGLFGASPEAHWKPLHKKLPIRNPWRCSNLAEPSPKYLRNLAVSRRFAKIPNLLAALAPELQALILCNLTWQEVLRLRTTCKFFRVLVQAHAGDIARMLIRRDVDLGRAHSLYRHRDSSQPTWNYFIALAHRCSTVQNLAHFLATYHLMDSLVRKTSAHRMQTVYAPVIEKMVTNLRPHLMIISHMLETYRSSVADLVRDPDTSIHEDRTNSTKRAQSWRKELDILREYNEMQIFTTETVFELLKKTLCRQLRPVSYAGSLERRVRGWSKPPASQEQVVSLMIFGGLSAVTKIVVIKSYDMRMRALELWMKDVLSPTARLEGKDVETLPAYQWLYPPLDPMTKDRMMAILPDLAHFFNIGELESKTGSQLDVPGPPTARIGMLQLLNLWRTGGFMRSDFDLRRHNGG